MKREALYHTKTTRLCRRLKLPRWQVVGLLECLWALCARETARGDIGKLSDEDIAAFLEYEGDSRELIEAFVDCGWLDRHEQYRLVVHDWADHADDALNMKLARAHQKFADGRIPKLTRFAGEERRTLMEFFGVQVDTRRRSTPGPRERTPNALPRRSHHQSQSQDQLQSPRPPQAQSVPATAVTLTNPSRTEDLELRSGPSFNTGRFLTDLDSYEPREQLKRIYQSKNKRNELPAIELLDAIEKNLLRSGVSMRTYVDELRTNHLQGTWENPTGLLRTLSGEFRSRTTKVVAPMTADEVAERDYKCSECGSVQKGEGLVLKDGESVPCGCASADFVTRMRAKGIIK